MAMKRDKLTFICSALVSGICSLGAIAHSDVLRIPGSGCRTDKSASVGGGTLNAVWDVGDLEAICPVVAPTAAVFHNFNLHYGDGNPHQSFSGNACVAYYARPGGACNGTFTV